MMTHGPVARAMNPHDSDNPDPLNEEVSPETLALRAYIERATELLNSEQAFTDDGALIYLGNPHIAIPRQMLICSELESDDKVIWSLLREAIHRPGHPALFPSQKQLASYIGKSSNVVNERIQILRIHRWITLCAYAGRSDSGKLQRPVYAIHDEPIPLADTLFLDESYLEWLSERQDSNASCVANAARQALEQLDRRFASGEDMTESPGPVSRSLCAMDDMIPLTQPVEPLQNDRLRHTESVKSENNRLRHAESVISGTNNRVEILHSVTTGPKPVENNRLRIAESVISGKKVNLRATICSSSCSSSNTTTTTTTTADADFQETANLVFPSRLKPQEVSMARGLLRLLPREQRQFALDYLRDRIADTAQKPLENAINYLRWLVDRLRSGEGLGPSSYGLRDESRPALAMRDDEETPEENERRWRAQLRSYGVDDVG